MDFNVLSTQNWSRMFNVWIEDIQVVCHPVVEVPFKIQQGFLRKVRTLVRYPAVPVILLFSLHCTRPVLEWVQPTARVQAPAVEAPVQVYMESGNASWYGDGSDGFAGLPTASGEPFAPAERTCAHRTLPFGTLLLVEHLSTGRHTLVRVNDRGPFLRGRMLDLSRRAAKDLGILKTGVAQVRIRSVDAQGRPAPVDFSADGEAGYAVQVAGLSDPCKLQGLASAIEPLFGPVTVQDVAGADGDLKLLRVGGYPRLEQAHMAADRIAKFIKDRNVEPFVTRVR